MSMATARSPSVTTSLPSSSIKIRMVSLMLKSLPQLRKHSKKAMKQSSCSDLRPVQINYRITHYSQALNMKKDTSWKSQITWITLGWFRRMENHWLEKILRPLPIKNKIRPLNIRHVQRCKKTGKWKIFVWWQTKQRSTSLTLSISYNNKNNRFKLRG